MEKKRHKTQHLPDSNSTKKQRYNLIEKIISIASQQKLLPRFVYQMDRRLANSRNKRFKQYQKIVKNIYKEEGKIPLKFDPEQAMTDQEKLREKILKSQNHQLQIDYFERLKLHDGRYVPLFNGHELQKMNYSAKNDYLMFNDFNEKKFRRSYSHIFDDKLQLQQASIFRKKKIKAMPIFNQLEQDQTRSIAKPPLNLSMLKQIKQTQNEVKKIKNIKLKPLTEGIQLQRKEIVPQKYFNEKYKPHIQKIKVGKILKDIDEVVLYKKMLTIGSFPSSVQASQVSLTKQSLTKYIKSFYDREFRIIDFLQIKPAIKLDQYMVLCTKLKLMQVQHVIFMTFLFYDFNNDGYICQNDIRRLKSIVQTKKNQLIQEDFKIIQSIRQKKEFDARVLFEQPNSLQKQISSAHDLNEGNYLELYKLPQVTQSTYFNWQRRIKSNQDKSFEQSQRQLMPQLQSSINNEKVELSKRDPKQIQFCPSVLKYKHSYFEERADVRKYILQIKAHKTYISFQEFKAKYEHKDENKSHTQPLESRGPQLSRLIKNPSIKASALEFSRYEPNKNILKLENYKKQTSKSKQAPFFLRPYLWYDLMQKLAGVRYENLKYE